MVAIRYAEAFGTTAAWLLTGKGKGPSERKGASEQVRSDDSNQYGAKKRHPGRPIRGVADVGRERLVEAARAVLRFSTAPGLSRKAVADEAGVTPALVSYYYPDIQYLKSAATASLITERVSELLKILNGSESREERLRSIVALFVELHEKEGHLIDHAFIFSRRAAAAGHQPVLLTTGYESLRTFVLRGIEAGEWRAVDPDQLLLAIWRMCRAISLPWPQNKHIGRSVQRYSDTVINLLLYGLRREGGPKV